MGKRLNLAGKRFGWLTVLSFSHMDKHGKSIWRCQCDCGNKIITNGNSLKRELTKSCGCLRKEKTSARATTHGHTKGGAISSEYRSWESMKKRCTNPNNKHYKNYGGRGIKVCERWLNSFEAFYADMGAKPFEGAQLDRIKTNGDYAPKNCRWVTRQQNVTNTRQQNNNTSGYKGVSWRKHHNKYCAKITHNYKTIHLGYFGNAAEAANAYDLAALQYHGEYAMTNKMLGLL